MDIAKQVSFTDFPEDGDQKIACNFYFQSGKIGSRAVPSLRQSPTFDRGDADSNPVQFLWDFWWAK
jgi:hypothetical protein